mmetsp:Transcript_149149/g.477697  ORF Transcript_149149/g.477697 Transcript_149149/m.477697 type:complete len:385 (+) Transcript_149149:1926-3080(+)
MDRLSWSRRRLRLLSCWPFCSFGTDTSRPSSSLSLFCSQSKDKEGAVRRSRIFAMSRSWLFATRMLPCLVVTFDFRRSWTAGPRVSCEVGRCISGNLASPLTGPSATRPSSPSPAPTRLAASSREKLPSFRAEMRRLARTLPRFASDLLTTRKVRACITNHFKKRTSLCSFGFGGFSSSWLSSPFCFFFPGGCSVFFRILTVSPYVPSIKCRLALFSSSKRSRPPSSSLRPPKKEAGPSRRIAVAAHSLSENAVRRFVLLGSVCEANSSVQAFNSSSSALISESESSFFFFSPSSFFFFSPFPAPRGRGPPSVSSSGPSAPSATSAAAGPFRFCLRLCAGPSASPEPAASSARSSRKNSSSKDFLAFCFFSFFCFLSFFSPASW